MESDFIIWIGFSLSFLAAFLFSLFHISLSSFSKISISRLLENKEKEYRLKILDLYDEIKIAVEYVRILLIVAFLVYSYLLFPRLKFWPLWLFLASLAVYSIFFEVLPRFLNFLDKKKVLALLLPSFKLPYLLAKPLLLIAKKSPAEKEEEELHEASEEEIEAFIEEAKEEGIIEKEEEVLLKSVVEFGDTVVREIMTPRVDIACIQKDATMEKLRDLVIKEKHSRIPVYKEKVDNIEGIVLAKDLLQYSDDKHKKSSIEPIIRPVHFIPESMKVAELLKEFQKRKQKLAIVVDEHGGISGLVTMEDLVEEIVGEIQDEYDVDEVQVTKRGAFDYVVTGDAEVEKIEELLDVELAEENYITVSGLITHHLGRLPELGENIQIKGLSLDILDVDQKRIKKLRIKKM
ncbi:MAG: HlyC/CorC family transporter [Candidatus Aminicenantes bacterium]|nr:MAG: HlyC/CorC family transporter [Candidatus Aminicenantes bacterium]